MNKTQRHPADMPVRYDSIASPGDRAIDRAMELLRAGGIDFEEVDRCPVACTFCDEGLSRAA